MISQKAFLHSKSKSVNPSLELNTIQFQVLGYDNLSTMDLREAVKLDLNNLLMGGNFSITLPDPMAGKATACTLR